MIKLTGQKRKEARTAAWRMMKRAERLYEMARIICYHVREQDMLRRGNMNEFNIRMQRVRKQQIALEAIGVSPFYPKRRNNAKHS